MAELTVTIPDGDFCENCIFNPYGTVICEYFDVLLSEDDDHGCVKCEQCPKE